MVVGWWMGTVAGAEPCRPDDEVTAARDAVVGGDLEAAGAALLRAEQAFGCGEVTTGEALARFWLVEGALLAREGDPAAGLSLSAARRVAPELWIDALGPELQDRWKTAAPEPGEGTLAFDLPPDGALAVAVDGAPFDGAPVAAGLHLVQVGDAAGPVRYAEVVYVGAGTVTHVTTGLAPPPPPPEPPPIAATPARPSVRLLARATTGVSFAVGQGLAAPAGGRTLTEPAAKLVLPIAVAGGARLGPAWVRAETGLGWLVGGPYLSVLGDGSPHRTPVRIDVGASGGITVDLHRPGLGPLEIGAASGIQWPGRLSERAVVAVTAPPEAPVPWVAEVRGGFNVATDRPVEPGLEVLFGVLLPE